MGGRGEKAERCSVGERERERRVGVARKVIFVGRERGSALERKRERESLFCFINYSAQCTHNG